MGETVRGQRQWPSSGRIVHVDMPRQQFTCLPALILETPPEDEQPAETIRVEVHPTNEFPDPITVAHRDSTSSETGLPPGQELLPNWHWPEWVGPER